MAAKNGTLQFMFAGGLRRTYSFYFDDTAGNPARFSLDGKAAAGSPDNIVVPAPCAVADMSLEAATGQTTTVIKVNDQPVSVILNANYLAALSLRAPLGLVLNGGSKLQMFQLA